MQEKYLNALDGLKMAPTERKGDIIEVDSAELWRKLLSMLDKKDYQYDTGFYGSLEQLSEKIAYFFHSALQGIEAAPNALRTLLSITDSGIAQSLFANAQCFTKVQLERSLQEQGSTPSLDSLFNSSLQTLSYQEGIRKPSLTMYVRARQRFEHAGISPNEVLCMGTRVADDLAHAKSIGFKTALYAADMTSLSATGSDLKDRSTKPDRLLTDLLQLREILN